MNRRNFLGLALGTVAAAAWSRRARAVAATPAAKASESEALAVAKRQILDTCATLAFPNGAIHAVRALGRETPLGAGDPFRLLLENYLVVRGGGGRPLLEVPVDKEGHVNAMLKTLLERGCEMDLEFALGGRTYRFQDYVDSSRRLLSYPGRLAIDEHSWSLMAMALVTPPTAPTWKNERGETVDLGRIFDDTSAALAQDTAMIAGVDLASPDPRRDCPALSRACGGLHMVYALAVALGAGHGNEARKRAFAGHMKTLVRRIEYDMKVTDSVERENVARAGLDAAGAVAYDARVKFLGHLFEIVGVVDRHRLHAFTAAERRQLDAARSRLCSVLVDNRAFPFQRYRSDHALYDSMTTGVCHAYYGLVLSRRA